MTVVERNLTDRPHGVVGDPCGESAVRSNWNHVRNFLSELNAAPKLFNQITGVFEQNEANIDNLTVGYINGSTIVYDQETNTTIINGIIITSSSSSGSSLTGEVYTGLLTLSTSPATVPLTTLYGNGGNNPAELATVMSLDTGADEVTILLAGFYEIAFSGSFGCQASGVHEYPIFNYSAERWNGAAWVTLARPIAIIHKFIVDQNASGFFAGVQTLNFATTTTQNFLANDKIRLRGSIDAPVSSTCSIFSGGSMVIRLVAAA